MKIAKHNLPVAEAAGLLGLRLFHLDDHVGMSVDLLGAVEDAGAGSQIVFVVKAAGQAGITLNQYGVSVAGQQLGADRQQSHAIFINFYLFGYTNYHSCVSDLTAGP
jgi:hypothetical protein